MSDVVIGDDGSPTEPEEQPQARYPENDQERAEIKQHIEQNLFARNL